MSYHGCSLHMLRSVTLMFIIKMRGCLSISLTLSLSLHRHPHMYIPFPYLSLAFYLLLIINEPPLITDLSWQPTNQFSTDPWESQPTNGSQRILTVSTIGYGVSSLWLDILWTSFDRIPTITGETSMSTKPSLQSWFSDEYVFTGLGDTVQQSSFCDFCFLVISWSG